MDDVVDIPSWLWLEDGGGGNKGDGGNEGDGGNKDAGSDSDSDDDSYSEDDSSSEDDSIGEDDGIGARTVDDRLRMWQSRFGNNLRSEFEDYDYQFAAEALWNAFDDGADSDEWESTDSELFNEGVVNVEVPVSPVAPRKELVREPDRYRLHLRLYLVGEELSDGGPTSEASTVVVHRYAWPAFPDEVVEAVLLRLPAAAQARCRAVCKAWLSILSSPEFCRQNFVESLTRMKPPLCAVDCCDDEDVPLSNHLRAPLYKSLKLDLSFLPEVFHSIDMEVHSCSPSGLLCLGCYVNEGMRFCVLNPMNQSFKVLPLLETRYGMASLAAEAATATDIIFSFKVYVTLDVEMKKVAIYSSITGEWKGFVGRSSPPGDDRPRKMPEETDDPWSLPMACNGSIYTLVCSNPPRLVELSTDSGARYPWSLILPYLDEHRDQGYIKGQGCITDCELVDHRGRLLCCRSGGIWMLDDAMEEWIPIAERCPPEILPPADYCKQQSLRLEKVQVAGDLVVFFHELQIGSGRSGKQESCPVAFDMLRKAWRKVPKGIAKLGNVFQAMPNLRF